MQDLALLSGKHIWGHSPPPEKNFFIDVDFFFVFLGFFYYLPIKGPVNHFMDEYMFYKYLLLGILILTRFSDLLSSFSRYAFLTHGYSVGVEVSYNREFLICIKFCETMVIVFDPSACFALVCMKYFDAQC